MKDILIVIGTILILLILIDGIRRKRNERYGRIKVSRSLKNSIRNYQDDDYTPGETPSYTSELPNGGARVVGQRDPSIPVPSIEKKAQAKSFIEKRSRQQDFSPAAERRSPRVPQQTNLNLDESVPMLMESVDEPRNHSLDQQERIEPSFSASRHEDLDERYEAPQHNYREDDYTDEEDEYEQVHHAAVQMSEPLENADLGDVDNVRRQEVNDYADNDLEESYSYRDGTGEVDFETDSYDEEQYDDLDEDDYDEESDEDLHGRESQTTQQNLTAKQPAEPEEVLIINVMAHKGEMFKGSELLDIILKCGMRYGSMDIFHRYTDAKGEGVLLFSMANMVKPGTFDLDAMDEFETPGVSLFMTLPIDADSMQSFELMVDTAHAIADGLHGEMKDEQRSAMTRQTLEHCRQRIRDFERMRLFRRPPR